LQKCQETHLLPVIETDAKLLEGQGVHSENSACQEIHLEI